MFQFITSLYFPQFLFLCSWLGARGGGGGLGAFMARCTQGWVLSGVWCFFLYGDVGPAVEIIWVLLLWRMEMWVMMLCCCGDVSPAAVEMWVLLLWRCGCCCCGDVGSAAVERGLAAVEMWVLLLWRMEMWVVRLWGWGVQLLRFLLVNIHRHNFFRNEFLVQDRDKIVAYYLVTRIVHQLLMGNGQIYAGASWVPMISRRLFNLITTVDNVKKMI